jgi:tetratricopeptide (TPR) repeat protein
MHILYSNIPYLIAVAAIVLFFLWRPFLKKNYSTPSSALPETAEAVTRKEIQQVDAGAVIVPAAPARTSEHSQKYKTANTLLDQQRMDEAIVIFKELITIPEEEETALISLGTCYNLKGDMENAMYAYKKALDINEKNYNALLGLASFNYKTKQYPSAVVYYKKANFLRPELPDAYWGLACAYYMMDEDALASENAKTFVQMVPDSRYKPQLEKMIID